MNKYILKTEYLKIKRNSFIAFGISYYINKTYLNCLYIYLFKIKIMIGKNEYE